MDNKPNSSRRLLYLGIGGFLIFLCLCLAAGAAGVYFYVFQRTEFPATAGSTAVYVLDVSSRMSLPAEGSAESRLVVARGVMAEIVRPSSAETAGLRVFGSGAVAQSCEDTDLVVPLAPAAQAEIAGQLGGLQPGPAPDSALAQALIDALRDLAQIDDFGSPRSLVVVTGGQDTCQVEAGRLVAQEAERAGIDLRVFVVGFQLSPEEAQAVKVMSEAVGEKALYFDAPDERSLRDILQRVQQYVDQPTAGTLAAVEAAAQEYEPPAVAEAVDPAPPVEADIEESPPPEPAEPTDEPAAPDEPTPTPTPETEATADDYQPETACDHPYFPIRAGASWSYQGVSDGVPVAWTWTVAEVSGDMEAAEAVIVMELADADFTMVYNWSCSPGGIVSYNFGSMTIADLDLGTDEFTFSFDVRDGEGIFLPSVAELEAGVSWELNYVLDMTMGMEGFSFESSSATNETRAAAGFEDVTVPAGAFSALRVNSLSATTTTMMGQTSTYSYSSSQWFVYGVGMVKNIDVSEGESHMELVSYTIP